MAELALRAFDFYQAVFNINFYALLNFNRDFPTRDIVTKPHKELRRPPFERELFDRSHTLGGRNDRDSSATEWSRHLS